MCIRGLMTLVASGLLFWPASWIATSVAMATMTKMSVAMAFPNFITEAQFSSEDDTGVKNDGAMIGMMN